MKAVSALCNKGIALSFGEIAFQGDVNAAVSNYLIADAHSSYMQRKPAQNSLPVIFSAWFEDISGRKTTQFYSGDPIYLIVETDNPEIIPIEIFISFWDNLRRPLWNFTHEMHGLDILPRNRNLRIRIAFFPPKLTVSEIVVDLAVGSKAGGQYYDHVINALKCSIIERNGGVLGRHFPEWPIFCHAEMTAEAI
jgi:hypothetical protein